jgi:hypothetical protein
VADLDGQEGEIFQSAEAPKRTADDLVATLRESLRIGGSQSLNERINYLPVLTSPKVGDAGKKLWVLLSRGVGNLKPAVTRTKREPNSSVAEVP